MAPHNSKSRVFYTSPLLTSLHIWRPSGVQVSSPVAFTDEPATHSLFDSLVFNYHGLLDQSLWDWCKLKIISFKNELIFLGLGKHTDNIWYRLQRKEGSLSFRGHTQQCSRLSPGSKHSGITPGGTRGTIRMSEFKLDQPLARLTLY